MTTAHRATWKAARGGLQEEGSFRLHVPSAAVSGKDAPTEPNLKLRADVERTEASRDVLRAALDLGEREAAAPARKRARFELAPAPELTLLDTVPDEFRTPRIEATRELDRDAALNDNEDSDEEEDNIQGNNRGPRDNKIASGNDGQVSARFVEDEESDEDDSDDDEAELLAELERIRKEREFERAKKQSEEQERLEREHTAKAAAGNPLLPNLNMFNDEISETASIGTGSVAAFAVKRRWDDDVIFRDQARGERKVAPRFINDTIRNDFHRRFMKKYMR